MDHSESLTVLRLLAAVAILSYASILDWRTRRVNNIYWIAMACLGLLLIPVQLATDKEPLKYALVLAPILAILSDIYWDLPEQSKIAKVAPALKYALAIALVVVLGYLWIDQEYFQHLLAVPVLMLFIVLMYMLDVVRGGADAKALIALSILFPFQPTFGSLPLLRPETVTAGILFPFAFVVLINAAIIVALFPIGYLLKNLAAREYRFPYGLLGYKMDVDVLKGKHVWLMENMEDGKHRLHVRPRGKEDLDKEATLLGAAGHKRVWVTPKIPFIIPIAASLVLTTIFGNFLLALFQL